MALVHAGSLCTVRTPGSYAAMIAAVERESWKTFTLSLRELRVSEPTFSRNISCRSVGCEQLLAKRTSFAWQSHSVAVCTCHQEATTILIVWCVETFDDAMYLYK